MAEPVIAVSHLTKSFDGKKVVDDLNLEVEQGEIYGFLGPNGSGKTTSIRMLCGLLTPDSGQGECLGYDLLTQTNEIKKQVGYMTQKFSLYDDLSVRENLTFMARMYEIYPYQPVVDAALADLGLTHRQNQLAGTLSGGWKQRLSLAACLLHKPRLLLLDEPTAGVDPKARREFWEKIHHLAAEGMTILVSTHYMDEAERCHRLAYIAYGHLIATGSPKELIAQSGLTTWSIEGGPWQDLLPWLRQQAAIEQVVAFGNVLHISGRDALALEHTLKKLDPHRFALTQQKPKLEDVFIQLMNQHQDADT